MVTDKLEIPVRSLKDVVCLYDKTTNVLLLWDSSETIKCKSNDFINHVYTITAY